MSVNLYRRILLYLKNTVLLPNRVRWLRSVVPSIVLEVRHHFYQNNINHIFSGLNDIDNEKPTFLVCSSHFRMLRYLEPLLTMAQGEGYQIVVLNSPRAAFDSEQFKITKYINSYKVIHLSPWDEIFGESAVSMKDYIFFMYAILYNFNIHAMLVDELHHPPLSRFVVDFPYIKELMPPIIAFKHALLFPDYLGTNGLQCQAKILKNYCNLHFVWGDLQKNMYSHLPQEKVISAGWNALDHLRNVSTSLSKKVFLVAGATYSGAKYTDSQVVEELLKHTDLEVYIKAHPSPNKKISYSPHDRLHIIGDFDDYIPVLASCAFSLSYGSNIFVESLSLGKPHVILPAPASSDHIFDPLRHLFIYNPTAKIIAVGKLLEMVDSQRAQWNQVDEYLSRVVANRFTSSEFMLRRIQEEIENHASRGYNTGQ